MGKSVKDLAVSKVHDKFEALNEPMAGCHMASPGEAMAILNTAKRLGFFTGSDGCDLEDFLKAMGTADDAQFSVVSTLTPADGILTPADTPDIDISTSSFE